MHPTHDSHDNEAARFPFATFTLSVLAQLAVSIGIFLLLAPHVFRAEVSHPLMIVLTTILLGLPLSLFEYLYHRYLLHSAVLPFLRSMHRAHSTHHGLTSVKAPVLAAEPQRLVAVKSEFPVEHDHQEDCMMFPYYAYSIFQAVFFVAMALPLKLLLPGTPAIIGTMFAVTFSYSAYELWHAALHLPYDKVWRPLMEHRRYGKAVRYAYGFHLMHHWRPTANLAVVGFWGFAIWDHLFRTHRRPENMPLDGAEVNFIDATLKKPRWPVAVLDRWQAGLFKASRKIEAFAAKLFLRRQAP